MTNLKSLLDEAADMLDLCQSGYTYDSAQARRWDADRDRIVKAIREHVKHDEPPATKTSNTSTIFTVEADWSEPPGNVEVVKYPDPPYQLLGDSGQIECPMCEGEGRVTPPSPNRTPDP